MARKSVLLLSLAIAFLSLPLTAVQDASTQQPAPTQDTVAVPDLFSDSVAVRVVNVEVFATDKKGNPIRGLTQKDFELYEDGRRVEITHFFAATDGTGSSAAPSPTPRAEALPAIEATTPPPQDPSKIPNVIAYIDNLNLRKAGRVRVLADLGTFLESSIDHGSRVMIVVHGREGLRPLLAPTNDKSKVAEALGSIQSMTAEGLRLDLDRREVLRQIRDIIVKFSNLPDRVDQGPCELGERELNLAVEFYARNAVRHNEVTANGLSIMVGALAGWPGLKTVIYVSDGLPQFAGTDLFSYLADLCPQASGRFMANFSRFDTSRIFDRITTQANANQVTLHTLEARGLTTLSIDSVDSEGPLGGFRLTPSPGNDRIRTANLQSTLYQLANDTGGRAVLNANDFALDLEKIGSDTRNYYSLGFTTRQRGDGRVHRLRVETTRAKIRIRHRKAYRDKPVEETLVERALGALIFDLEHNPLAATVEISQALTEAGDSEVRLHISIPQDKLALLPVADQRQGKLRLVLTARDADNKMMPIKQKFIPVVSVDEDGTAHNGEARLEIGIELPAGAHELVLAIRDEISTSTSFLRRTVQVQDLVDNRHF